MRIFELKVYKFNELPNVAQITALNDYYDDFGYGDNNSDFQNDCLEILKNIGFDNVGLNYSLNNCQGDGLSFTFKLYVNDIIRILSNSFVPAFDVEQKIKDILTHMLKDFKLDEAFIINNELEITSTRIDRRYYHKYSTRLEYSSKEENLSIYTDMLFELIKTFYYQICIKLEEYGYDCIYDKMDFSSFGDLSDCNNWEYTIDGKLFNEKEGE